MSSVRIVILAALCVILVLVSVSDIRFQKIPDKYIFIMTGIGIVSIPFFLEIDLLSRVIGFFVVSLPLLLLTVWRPGSFGGGDVKLMAASGLFFGWQRNLTAFAAAVLLAGFYLTGAYLAGLVCRRKWNPQRKFALGPFLCAGIMAAMFFGEQMIRWFLY